MFWSQDVRVVANFIGSAGITQAPGDADGFRIEDSWPNLLLVLRVYPEYCSGEWLFPASYVSIEFESRLPPFPPLPPLQMRFQNW